MEKELGPAYLQLPSEFNPLFWLGGREWRVRALSWVLKRGGADKMTGSQGVRPDRQVLQGPTIDRESRHISEK